MMENGEKLKLSCTRQRDSHRSRLKPKTAITRQVTSAAEVLPFMREQIVAGVLRLKFSAVFLAALVIALSSLGLPASAQNDQGQAKTKLQTAPPV